jgi:hypothetical protein
MHDDIIGMGPTSSIAISSYEHSLCLESNQCELRFEYLTDLTGILYTRQGSLNLEKTQDYVDIDSFGYHDCIVRYALRRSKYFNSNQENSIEVENWRN